MLVSTVTAITSGTGRPAAAAPSAAARAAACIIALPPDAWTLIIQAPVLTAASTACATVLGMSWNFRSRKTREPDSTSRRTRSGPAVVKRRLPIFSPPATPRTCSATANARSAFSTSSATRSRSPPRLVDIGADRVLDTREPVPRQPHREACEQSMNHVWSLIHQRRVDLDERGARSDALIRIVSGKDAAYADDRYPPAKVAKQHPADCCL